MNVKSDINMKLFFLKKDKARASVKIRADENELYSTKIDLFPQKIIVLLHS